MRTARLDQPGSWRAWDGSGFNVRFANPYRSQGTARTTCARRCRSDEIAGMTDSLTYNTYLDKYMLVSARRRAGTGRRGDGVGLLLLDLART